MMWGTSTAAAAALALVVAAVLAAAPCHSARWGEGLGGVLRCWGLLHAATPSDVCDGGQAQQLCTGGANTHTLGYDLTGVHLRQLELSDPTQSVEVTFKVVLGRQAERPPNNTVRAGSTRACITM